MSTPANNFPPQTPLFYATHRDRYARQSQIEEIEQVTGRRLIIYLANLSHPLNSITRDDIAPFSELVSSLANDCDVDFMLESPGGDPNAAETIVNTLLSKAKNLRLIIPQAAKSAATMISLAADEILMSDTSELGPIDPQIPMLTNLGTVYRPAQAFLNGLEAIKKEHTSSQTLNPAYWPFLQGVDAALIDSCNKAIEHSKNLAIKWLSRSMCSDLPKCQYIAKELTDIDKYPNHGAVINYSEAQTIGLKVTYMPPSNPVWELMWRLYIRYSVEMKEKTLVKVFESSKTSAMV